MSRKWERKLERNAKRIDQQRKRFGQSGISEAGKDERLYGRSIMLPSFLLFVGIFYMITFYGVNRGAMYWVTVLSYWGLAFIVFFLRRPVLIIGKQTLTTRKFAGFRTVNAGDIDHIEALRGYVIIALKNKKARWVFSRMTHRYNTAEMAEKLKQFAKANRVEFKQEQTSE